MCTFCFWQACMLFTVYQCYTQLNVYFSYFRVYKEKTEKVKPEQKVVRGGSWRERPKYSTSAIRKAYYPWQRPFNVGFRVIVEE